MPGRRLLAAAVVGFLAVSCSGSDADSSVDPTVVAQRWRYTQLESIRSTFIDSAAAGIEQPDGYDDAGSELWGHYRDTQATMDGLDSSIRDDTGEDTTLDAWIESTKALFVHAYGSGIAADMIAAEIDQQPAIIVESSAVQFEDGRPVAVIELDQDLQQDGCEAIERGYYVWVGQTNIDEIAGRASIFARYALDQAATAGCDWAIIELTQRALRVSGLHDDADAAPTSADAAPATTARSDVTTTAHAPATGPTTTLDEWDVYYPIQYAPGFRLRVTEPAPCDGVLRPAMVSANSYISAELVGRGFVMVDLRTDGPDARGIDAQFLQEIADVGDRIGIAVQWLRAHADEYCVAHDAIAVTGYSYGALAAMALAYSDGEPEAGELVEVDLMGPPVVPETQLISPPAELATWSNDPDAVVAHAGFAIADTIDPGEPPLLMFSGRNDPLIPFALAEQTCAAALAVDIVCEMVAHDEQHAFSADDREAVDLVTNFLEREMVVPAGLSLGN